MDDIAVWWLAVELIGLAAFPLTFAVLRFLPDRGYAVTKVVGLLLISYAIWLGGTTHVLPFGRLSIAAVIMLMTAASAVIAFRYRTGLREFLENRWAHLLFVDALFVCVFALCLFLRSLASDSLIGGNDNRFTIAFVNTILRSDYFPPEDPWLAGESVSYYYFAFVIVGMLTKLTGIASEVTFNLMIATVPALVVCAMSGVVYNALIDRGKQPLVYGCGVLAGILLVFMANIESVFEFMAIHGLGTQGFFDSLDVHGLGFYRSSTEWYPTDGAWTFRSINFSGNRFDSIFPFFDMMLPVGYLSGRNTAIPIVLLVVTAIVNVWRSDSSFFRGATRTDAAAVGFIALAMGALIATHAWDFPTASALILVTLLCRNYWLEGKLNRAVLTRSALFVVAILALAALFYLPYFTDATGQFNGIAALQPEVATEPHHMLYLWLPLFWLAAGLGLFALTPDFRLKLPIVAAVMVVPVIVVLLWVGLRVIDGSFSLLREDVETRGDAWIAVAILVFLFTLLGAALLKQVIAVPVERRQPPLVFALSLATLALLLIIGIEFFYVKESTSIIVFDITTVLRVNFQAWLLLSLTGAFGIYYIASLPFPAELASRLVRMAWAGGTVMVISAGLLFPVMAGFYYDDLIKDLGWGRHIDGLAGLRRVQPDEYEAVQYLRDSVEGTPVIMEGVTDSYHSGARVSAFTGLPTVLGWVTHEFWFRGTYEPWTHRREDVALAYRTPSPTAALAILRLYGVEYVYFGRLEREQYGMIGYAKFTTFMDVIFQKGEVTIFRVRADSGPEAVSSGPPATVLGPD